MTTLRKFLLTGAFAISTACGGLEFGDLNQPDLEEELLDPDRATISGAMTGLLVRNRLRLASQAGYVSEVGVLGRESYVLDPADPRYRSELLSGTEMGATKLNPGNGAFGGNFWEVPYRAVRLAELLITAADLSSDFLSAEEINAVKGWALFHQAYALMAIVNTHVCPAAVSSHPFCNDSGDLRYGAVLAFDQIDPFDPATLTPEALNTNAPIVNDSGQAYEKVIALLDASIAALAATGSAEFPSPMPSGFAGFDTPATLLPAVHALKARAALYNDDMTTAAAALAASFLDTADTSFTNGMSSDVGVFHSFSQNSGDATNGLFADPDILAHPSLETDAELQDASTTLDARFVQKIRFNPDEDMDGNPDPTILSGLSSTINFGGLYPTNTTHVPYVRNEELILIRAEVLARTGDTTGAAALVNFIRENSGGLAALVAADLDTEGELLAEILKQRRYSLMFEGGHRFMDVRRLNAVGQVPLDRLGDIANLAWPISLDEINARIE